MARIVQDKERSLRVIGKDFLTAKERLKGVPVHSQMSFNGYSTPLHQGAGQDTLEISLNRVPMDEDNNRPQPGLKRHRHLGAGRRQAVEVAVVNDGRLRDQTPRLRTGPDCRCLTSPRAASREKSITEDRRGEDASKDFVGDVRSRALDGQCKVQTTLKGSGVLGQTVPGPNPFLRRLQIVVDIVRQGHRVLC